MSQQMTEAPRHNRPEVKPDAKPDAAKPDAKPDAAKPEMTPEQKAKAEAEAKAIAEVEAFTFARDLGDKEDITFAKTTTPVRNRRPLQLAMDKVAARAYADWVAAKRPTLWQNMPVVTYFLDPEQVSDYRSLIRKACEIVTPEPYDKEGKHIEPTGVRVRFGNEFVLTEKMAERIGKPDKAGKTVLAWAAIDKRNVTKPDSK